MKGELLREPEGQLEDAVLQIIRKSFPADDVVERARKLLRRPQPLWGDMSALSEAVSGSNMLLSIVVSDGKAGRMQVGSCYAEDEAVLLIDLRRVFVLSLQ